MKTIALLLLGVLPFITTGCSKESEVNRLGVSYLNTSLCFKLFDKNNNDLLSPSTQGYYDYPDIDVIYYKNCKPFVYYKRLLTASKGYSIDTWGSFRYMRLYLDLPEKGNNTSMTYVRFRNSKIYAFKAEFDIRTSESDGVSGSSIFVKKVWLDGVLFNDKTDKEGVQPWPVITL